MRLVSSCVGLRVSVKARHDMKHRQGKHSMGVARTRSSSFSTALVSGTGTSCSIFRKHNMPSRSLFWIPITTTQLSTSKQSLQENRRRVRGHAAVERQQLTAKSRFYDLLSTKLLRSGCGPSSCENTLGCSSCGTCANTPPLN